MEKGGEWARIKDGYNKAFKIAEIVSPYKIKSKGIPK